MASEKESRVLEAATSVFLRYGYRRTTMGDIAGAAGISRPALYLLFCNKERIFDGVLRRHWATILEDIRTGITDLETPREKLRLAFELWAVRPFTLMLGSPDARDLIHCGYVFAGEALTQGYVAFEAQLVAILETVPGASRPKLGQVAHVLATSVHGFKETARSATELQEMIEVLLDLAITSLESGSAKG